MQVRGSGKMLAVVGAVFALGVAAPAEAARSGSKHQSRSGGYGASHGGGQLKAGSASVRYAVAHGGGRKSRGAAYASYGYGRSYAGWGGGISCVPYARENSGIELAGNAGTWWGAAAGVYERGAKPEVGSVLNFRSTGRMRMGHVAVVTNVVSGRVLEIDHANWDARGRVSRGVRVVDVSEGNDWSAVRVGLASGDYGSIYPTYGFIYDRPDRGTMLANNRTEAMPVLAAAHRDNRPAVLRSSEPAEEFDEVAEAPEEADAPAAARGYRTVRVRQARATTLAPRVVTAHARISAPVLRVSAPMGRMSAPVVRASAPVQRAAAPAAHHGRRSHR